MNVLSLLESVKVFVFDVDGVLTNGMLYSLDDGTQLKAMNTKDGYALQLAVKRGYHVWVISGASSVASQIRLQKLGVQHAYFEVENKLDTLNSLLGQYQLSFDDVLYMGDDMPDEAVMQYCKIKAAPADAADDIKVIANYISPYNGGMGCVRDVIEKVLKLHNKWK